MTHKYIVRFFLALTLTSLLVAARAQEIAIPDLGLNTAIREALQKLDGPLTEQDLLTLTNLNASRRDISNTAGLEAACNLITLNLQINRLTNFSIPDTLTRLTVLDVSVNSLTNCSIPNGLTNLGELILEVNQLQSLDLPADLTGLHRLNVANNQFTSLNASNLSGLVVLDLGFNSFTDLSLPSGLTNLTKLLVKGNPLTNVVLPADMTALSNLQLDQNQLTGFTLPKGLTNLVELDLSFNQLTSLRLPSDQGGLTELNLDFNRFTSLTLPTNLAHLSALHLRDNLLTNFDLPEELTNLSYLDLSRNQLTAVTLPEGHRRLSILVLAKNKLTDFTLPKGMTNLTALTLADNQLTNNLFPPDLGRLVSLDLSGNLLTSFTMPPGLTNLFGLFLTGNQLTNITLVPDLVEFGALGYSGNPVTTLVLPEFLAATTLAAELTVIRNLGISVFTYPLTAQLVRPRSLSGAFQIGITGPPGDYVVFSSTNLASWTELGIASNTLGAINFTDVTAHFSPQKFYRIAPRVPPPQMVFIPPVTFTMGSPIDEQDRGINEGPQTTVTLTRGFWIGAFEVTQAEYLSVTGTNPSLFPGDPNRPVSSVSWPDATNYCALLTQRELAAGRIPPGSQYRLPTEAEWECAARAGTTTRFSYGDDPDYSDLMNYAWQNVEDGLTVHPVGQKLPNPWGLYDMMGNVFEWCQDWFGPLPGGSTTDPQGPLSNPIGWKSIRGGAFDFGGSACRSASRMFFGNHPSLTDWNLGFRVALVIDP